MEPFTAAYKGSTSMRGLRGALAFLLRSVCREARLGSVPEERVGVVDTSISFGRMVPAMMAVVTRRGGAQCVAMCALRVGRAAGLMRVPTAERDVEMRRTATGTTTHLSRRLLRVAGTAANDPR